MITTDELKVQLAEHAKAVKDLEEALAIEASRKRVQELEHTMSRPGFYDDAELSKKVFDEVGDLKGKLNRFEKLQGLYDDAETMLEMLDEEYDPAMIPEAEEAVNTVGKAVEELQLMTMLNGAADLHRYRRVRGNAPRHEPWRADPRHQSAGGRPRQLLHFLHPPHGSAGKAAAHGGHRAVRLGGREGSERQSRLPPPG